MPLLKFLFIAVLVYYALKLILKSAMPYLFESYMDKLNKQMGGDTKNFQKRKNRKDGQITVDYEPQKEKIIENETGEYVDFEEIKE